MNKVYFFVLSLLKRVLNKADLTIKRSTEISLVGIQHVNACRLLQGLDNQEIKVNTTIGVVFSKDRPMQLYALLKSYAKNVENPVPLVILYNASSNKYEEAYSEVSLLLRDLEYTFVRENKFKESLVDILDGINQEKIFFLVDDIVFTEKLDMEDFVCVDSHKEIASMRLGNNLSFAYTANKMQPLPELEHNKNTHQSKKLKWKWSNGCYDWGYPLSVDGNLFITKEVRAMIKIAEFKAPNSLEKSMQWFNSGFLERYGVCYAKSKIINIPFNKVQSENCNIAGEVSSRKLLQLWEQGYELDLEKYYGIINISAHQECPLYVVERV